MLGKITIKIISAATIVSTTLPFLASSALADEAKVHVVRTCQTYNDDGEPYSPLIVGEYYPLVEYISFNDGQEAAKVLIWDSDSQENRTINIATRCLESNQGQVLEY
jgi:hypothetical protein